MGLEDRDYMRERYKRQTHSGGTGPVRRPSWLTQMGSTPKWIGYFVLAFAAIYFTANYALEFARSVPFPQSGDVHWYTAQREPGVARLTLSAPTNVTRNFAVRLDDWESRKPLALIPVRAGESSVTLLPLGRYRMTIATGKTWLGSERMFGRSTELRQVVYPLEFYQRGNETMGQRIELEVPFRGNMETVPARL